MSRSGAAAHEWAGRARCRVEDPDLFFPPGAGAASQQQMHEARTVCRACPVADACLEFALAVDAEFGMWGGLTALERRRLKRRRIATERRDRYRDRAPAC
ncbi:WhiB family transcriptional regulator [Nocardioides maradonensis]